jgi:PAS domain-containing protein
MQTLPRQQIRALQLARLQRLVRRVWERPIPFFRRKLEAGGMTPADVRSLDDLRGIPTTIKNELRVASEYGVKTQMATAVRPRGEEAWLMGLHQCSHERQWSTRERRLFQAIGERASEALLLHIINQKLRVSENRLAFVLESNPGVLYAARLGQPAICTYISPSIQRILGYMPDEVTRAAAAPSRTASLASAAWTVGFA